MLRQYSRHLFGAIFLGLLAAMLLLPAGASAQAEQIKQQPLQLCKDVQAYKDLKQARYEKAASSNYLTFDKARLDQKFARYDNAYCGQDGLPHLITDGRLDRAGDFVIPGLLFLYLAGALGWAGRSYLAQSKGAEDEILIDLPKALACLGLGLIWPLQAIPELISGKIRVPEDRVTVSPR